MGERETSEAPAHGVRHGFREPSFIHIIETLAVPAMIFTGHLRNPVDENQKPDLEMAKYQISLLEILEERTRGKLTPDEESYLEEMLHTVRMAYVHAAEESRKPAKSEA